MFVNECSLLSPTGRANSLEKKLLSVADSEIIGDGSSSDENEDERTDMAKDGKGRRKKGQSQRINETENLSESSKVLQ